MLILTVAIAKTISIVDKPHDAAAFVEAAMGSYWPVILAVIALASVGLALFPLGRD